MSPPLELLPVAPIGTRETDAVATSGHAGKFVEPVYPDPPVDLRAAWQEAELTLRTAAQVLRLKPSELYALVRGQLRPTDDADWQRMVDALRPPPAARWGRLTVEGDLGGNEVHRYTRDRADLQHLAERMPDVRLVEGADGRLELWCWVRDGRRVRPGARS